ncbi:MAG: hypothetical protein EBT02_14515, partial [Planctomycetia bacterium]|nr:hypothetical protein [Planctomycetia bacterium]
MSVTVNPLPVVANQTISSLCSDVATGVNFNSSSATAAATLSLGGATVSAGGAAVANGLTASALADDAFNNVSSAAISVVYTVVPVSAEGCLGASFTVTISVKPEAVLTAISNSSVCNGAVVSAQTFSTTNSLSTDYAWTNNTTSIGLAASGTTSVPSFTSANTTNASVTASVTVTTSTAEFACVGNPLTYTITIKPTPTVNALSAQQLCVGQTTSTVTFASDFNVSGTTYSWTNTNTNIGLGVSGTGNISGFTAANTTTSNISGTITVTPSADGCTGTTQSMLITVKPKPTATISGTTTICSGTETTMSIALTGTSPWSLTYTDGTTPVTVTNTSTNPYTFLTGNLTNSGTSTAATTYTITALSDASSCTAISSNYAGSAVVTVNPVPTVNDPTDISACAGSNFVETTYTGAVSGTVYTWTNNNTSTGLAASGTGNIGEFAGTNATNAAIVSTVTVTPSYGSSPTCSGSPQTFTLTVNPKPVVLAQTATICTGSSFTVTPTNGGGYIIPVGGSGTHYTWSAPTAAGLTGMSTGSGVSSFSSGTLLNSTNA